MPISAASRVVILGGTSGIGLAIARAAAAAGASVAVASRNPASVRSALAELPAGSVGHVVDASSTEDLAAFFELAGDFDHFAYTAADHLVPTPLADYTADKGRAFFELRLVAALDAIRLAVPHIRPGGSITMTSRHRRVPRRCRLVPRLGSLRRDHLGGQGARRGTGPNPGQRRRPRRGPQSPVVPAPRG
jgi:NAD(P)-dependent dehydrogenase (short-subunit alcohol dehydrogenase family)